MPALIPGRPAPELVTKAMVESMKPGSVLVDLAVEQGGNCKLSVAGKVTDHKGVKLVAHKNVPGRLSGNASELYARNLYNFIDAFYDKDTKQLTLDWEDEIIAGIALTRDGNIVHEGFVGTAKAAKDLERGRANRPKRKQQRKPQLKPQLKPKPR